MENLQFLQDMKELRRCITVLVRALVANPDVCKEMVRFFFNFFWFMDARINCNT